MDPIIYFVITIGILVFVHEFGHFAAAKICGMRTDVFAIGFGKRLLGWNKINGFSFGQLPKDFDGQGYTDYRLSLLPLGGYVKIAGMVDESFDTEFADSEPKPYEFRAKPAYQKLFVITAGVMMNLTLTLGVFWGINLFQGTQAVKTTTIGIIADGSPAAAAGFESSDKIVSINGSSSKNWEEILNQLFIENIGKTIEVEVLRKGENVKYDFDSKIISETKQGKLFLSPAFTHPYITTVFNNSPAMDAGIQEGDILIRLNKIKLTGSDEIKNIISSNPDIEIPAVILRDNDTVYTAVKPGIDGLIGIEYVEIYTGPMENKSYGIFESFSQSINDIGYFTQLTFSYLGKVIRGDIAFNRVFGGPVKIAQIAAKSAESGMISFLRFLAMLSLSLAIINILPFPVLDGGHVVIIIIEGVIRRELPIKVKVVIQNVGFVILLLLMAFIIYSDIISL